MVKLLVSPQLPSTPPPSSAVETTWDDYITPPPGGTAGVTSPSPGSTPVRQTGQPVSGARAAPALEVGQAWSSSASPALRAAGRYSGRSAHTLSAVVAARAVAAAEQAEQQMVQEAGDLAASAKLFRCPHVPHPPPPRRPVPSHGPVCTLTQRTLLQQRHSLMHRLLGTVVHRCDATIYCPASRCLHPDPDLSMSAAELISRSASFCSAQGPVG